MLEVIVVMVACIQIKAVHVRYVVAVSEGYVCIVDDMSVDDEDGYWVSFPVYQ